MGIAERVVTSAETTNVVVTLGDTDGGREGDLEDGDVSEGISDGTADGDEVYPGFVGVWLDEEIDRVEGAIEGC